MKKKDKNELIKSLLMILPKYENAVLSNNNKKPPRKIEKVQQGFQSHFGKLTDSLIKKKSIGEDIVHGTEKNTKNVHNVTLEHDKDIPKYHLRPTTSIRWLF